MPPAVSALKKVDHLLAQVTQRGLSRIDPEVVRAVALEVWYGTDVPDLSALDGPHVADAVLLVERLSFYNVLGPPRKKALLTRVRAQPLLIQHAARVDFESAYKAVLPLLQPLQSRHFALSAHEKTPVSGTQASMREEVRARCGAGT